MANGAAGDEEDQKKKGFLKKMKDAIKSPSKDETVHTHTHTHTHTQHTTLFIAHLLTDVLVSMVTGGT